jgi:hypothetical protein
LIRSIQLADNLWFEFYLIGVIWSWTVFLYFVSVLLKPSIAERCLF